MSNALLVLRDVKRQYRTRDHVVDALRGIDIEVERGRMVAVIGKSGSGKTTLLSVVGALDRPTSGDVVVDGLALNKLPENDLVAYRRKKVGFVFQDYHLVPNLTALENVMLPMEYAGRPAREAKGKAHDLLRAVLLEHRARHRPGRLSGGEQQRVAIARALANDPPLLLADEPTGNLDTATGREVVGLLRRFVHEEGRTAIVVTHDPYIAEAADEHVNIEDGRIVARTRDQP